ncbi:MAG: ABC transporter ATP-binding protein [Exilispira sp.]
MVEDNNLIKYNNHKESDKKFQLKSINFEVYQSEVLSILGPNGCGKTTILKLISKIYKAEYGSISYNGIDIRKINYKEYSKLVHYVPQNSNLFPDFSVIDTIVTGINPELGFFEFPSRYHYQKARQLLEDFGYLDLIDKNLNQISGGEVQLVFFLRALMSNVEILIFDEPTAFLDFKNQSKILNVIKKISQKNKTIIVSLHDPNHVLRISDRVILLKDGQIFSSGKPEDILTEENLGKLYEYPVKRLKAKEENYYFFRI